MVRPDDDGNDSLRPVAIWTEGCTAWTNVGLPPDDPRCAQQPLGAFAARPVDPQHTRRRGAVSQPIFFVQWRYNRLSDSLVHISSSHVFGGRTTQESRMRRSFLSLLFISFAGWSQPPKQLPRPATKPKTPTVNCSEPQSLKACSSFKQLLEAHDKEILESISQPTSYACFRPTDDAFLIFHADDPGRYGWKKSDDGFGEMKQFPTSARLTEYRDGVSYSIKDGRASWYRSAPDAQPVFNFESKDGRFKGLTIDIYPAEILVAYPFDNQASVTTQYSLAIRRSTGRFTETYSSEGTPSTTHSGTCVMYQ